MKIIMTHESTINAIGKQRNANRKEVFCITDGKIYASVVDAAETIGVTGAAISRHLTGIAHTCTGKNSALQRMLQSILKRFLNLCRIDRRCTKM